MQDDLRESLLKTYVSGLEDLVLQRAGGAAGLLGPTSEHGVRWNPAGNEEGAVTKPTRQVAGGLSAGTNSLHTIGVEGFTLSNPAPPLDVPGLGVAGRGSVFDAPENIGGTVNAAMSGLLGISGPSALLCLFCGPKREPSWGGYTSKRDRWENP